MPPPALRIASSFEGQTAEASLGPWLVITALAFLVGGLLLLMLTLCAIVLCSCNKQRAQSSNPPRAWNGGVEGPACFSPSSSAGVTPPGLYRGYSSTMEAVHFRELSAAVQLTPSRDMNLAEVYPPLQDASAEDPPMRI